MTFLRQIQQSSYKNTLSVHARTTKYKHNGTKMFYNTLDHHLDCLPCHFVFMTFRVCIKMASCWKTATPIWLYDVPRNVAEDLMIAFLQSDLFWQVTRASSKTKASTEISA